MRASNRIVVTAAALAAVASVSFAVGNDSLRMAETWTKQFRERLPVYQARVTQAIRTGRTTDKTVMDSLRAEVRALGVLLMKRDSVLLASPGNGWPLVAGLEDNIALVDAAPPYPGFLVQLAYHQRWYAKHFASLSGADSAGIEPQARKRIESTIIPWGDRVDEKLWPSLQLALIENGVTLGPFSGGDAFVATLSGYIESRHGSAEDRTALDAYQRFKLFWGGELRSLWLPVLVVSGRLKPADLQTLDRLVERWDRSTMPRAWWEDVYAAAGIIGILVAAVAVFSFWRKRRKT